MMVQLLRFGDDNYGRRPPYSSDNFSYHFTATYHIGNGLRGNVGAEAITRVVKSNGFDPTGIMNILNPMQAQGGTEPESMKHIRIYASESIHTLKRAVTEDDYIQVLEKYQKYKKALLSCAGLGAGIQYL